MRILLCIAALSLLGCGGSESTSEDVIVLDEPASQGGESDDSQDEAEAELVVGDETCESDADCVPAGCCHAAACTSVANAPACEETMCTSDCQFGTLDCGGACLCHEGRCAARLSRPPEIEVQ